MRVVSGGVSFDLGDTETTPTISITDYSRRTTDDFGVTTVTERGFARRMSVRMKLPFDSVDGVQQKLAALRATSASWIADETIAWLSVDGFYKDFEIDLNVPPTSFCTLTVEGLTETEVVTDAGADPSPIGLTSSLRLIQPTPVTDAVLTSSTVAETDYAEWVVGTTYAAGVRAKRTSTHRVYESLIAGNVGHDPVADTGEWLDVRPTNRWAMFDQALGTATTAAASIAVTLAAANITALALLDVAGATVRVQTTGYDQTHAVGAGAVTFLDLPGAAAAITVTVTGPGTVSVGTLLIGKLVTLGVTEASPSASITDYSRKNVDDFGAVTIVQRAWAKRMTARALIRTDAVDQVANRITAVRAQPSLWIGSEGIDGLTIYGFFKDFSIEVGETVSKLSLSIEGLSKAAALTDPLADLATQIAQADADAAAAQATADTGVHDAAAAQSTANAATALAASKSKHFVSTVLPLASVSTDGDTFDLIDANGVVIAEFRRLAGDGTLSFGGLDIDFGGLTLGEYAWAPSDNVGIANFNARNDRLGTAIAAPTIAGDGTAIDHTQNDDGSIDLSFEWGWAGDEATIDGFIVTLRSSTSSAAYVMGAAVAEEVTVVVTADRRAQLYFGVPSNRYYTAGVQAYRIVDPDISPLGKILSTVAQSALAAENPYLPNANVAFAGNITGTVGAVAAATVAGATNNFNTRNDRNAAAIVAPTVAIDGTAVDHTINTDGSADLSLEWGWTGSENDIDGWLVYVRGSTSAAAYTFGSAPAEESTYQMGADRRALILPGVSANLYYTLGVRAFRFVDQDIAASGRIMSTLVKATLAAENPYQPAASVAFGGNITGTVNGVAVATVTGGAARANAGLDASGNVQAGKVSALSLAADVVNKIVSASATNITATDSGNVLLTLSGVATKPSQGGYVHVLLNCQLAMAFTSAITSNRLFGRLQRRVSAGPGAWSADLQSWLLGYMSSPVYIDGTGTHVWAQDYNLTLASSQQFIDIPPADDTYDYQIIVSRTSTGTGSSPPEYGTTAASKAVGIAISVKVAS